MLVRRGSSGILSFHIFDPSCVSHNGFNNGLTLRKELAAAGLLKKAD